MRPVDASASHRIAARDASSDDGAHVATQFGDSLRAAAQRANAAVDESPDKPPSPRPGNSRGDSTNEESAAAHALPVAGKPVATPPRAETTASEGQQQAQPR